MHTLVVVDPQHKHDLIIDEGLSSLCTAAPFRQRRGRGCTRIEESQKKEQTSQTKRLRTLTGQYTLFLNGDQ